MESRTYNASKLTFDRLVARLNLFGHQLELITFLATLVKILAEYQQCFTFAVQLPLASLQLKTAVTYHRNHSLYSKTQNI